MSKNYKENILSVLTPDHEVIRVQAKILIHFIRQMQDKEKENKKLTMAIMQIEQAINLIKEDEKGKNHE